MKVTRKSVYLGITLAWALFSALAWTHQNFLGILNTVGFAALITIPGFLTVLGIGGGKRRLPFWHRFGQVIGWSVLEIMSFLLLCNTILPHLHLARPLDRHPLVIELSVLCIGLGVWSWLRLKRFSYKLTWRQLYKTKLDVIFTLIPLLFVALSVLGAISLNNGGTDLITLSMLASMGIYMSIMFICRQRFHDNTFAWALYMMGLSLLLMTSLRGWYSTGHDIQREYRVFQLAKQHGVWNIAYFRDPFNACLSITILPTTFANLLHIPDPYVFKVYFQLIFATVPVLVYQSMRRYFSKGSAFLSVIYFIAFPTYFTDMCMMNRQEMGFLFVALMLLCGLDTRLSARVRHWLVMAFGLGMILSHYSTTYSTIFIMAMAVAARPVFNLIAPWLGKRKFLAQTAIDIPKKGTMKKQQKATVGIVVSLAIAAFAWNSVLTNTSTATAVLKTTFSSITSGLKEDNRSDDVSYSLLSGGTNSPQQQLKSYEAQTVAERANAPAGTYYPLSVTNSYPLTIAPAATVPLTALGRLLSGWHINVGSLNYTLKQSSAKLLQVFVVIGLVYVIFRNKLSKKLEPEFLLLSLACLVFLALQVVLPYLSVAYGVLRAFQQSLMVIGALLVIGTYALTDRFKRGIIHHGVPTALAIAFFLSSTGVISQTLGGYQPQLHLNNSGQYYDNYYLHTSEVVESTWLQQQLQAHGTADVQSDLFTATRLNSLTGINVSQDITPSVIQTDAYVVLGYTDVTKGQVTISYNGNLINYTYPKAFLNQNKNLIYNNGGAEIYR